MKTFQIAVLPGDGIGPDVVSEALRVLRAVEQRAGLRLECKEVPAGAGEYLRNGDPLPDSSFEQCRQADAILLGAMGMPNVRWPDGREMTPQIDLRERLGLYAGVRPIRLYHSAHSPLRPEISKDIDFVIYRESTEGLFSTRLQSPDLAADRNTDTLLITRATSERLFRAAFREAQRRRKLLTLIDKANVLPSMVFFRHIFDEISREFPDVRTERVYVDAASLYLVQQPQHFDVLVTENMFGDILSDLAAGLVGGMGMAPSADVGDQHAVFQPSHGSAPDITGKGIANPVATILSVALMLEWLGTPECLAGAGMIRRATESVLREGGNATADIGGRLTTTEMGERITAAL